MSSKNTAITIPAVGSGLRWLIAALVVITLAAVVYTENTMSFDRTVSETGTLGDVRMHDYALRHPGQLVATPRAEIDWRSHDYALRHFGESSAVTAVARDPRLDDYALRHPEAILAN